MLVTLPSLYYLTLPLLYCLTLPSLYCLCPDASLTALAALLILPRRLLVLQDGCVTLYGCTIVTLPHYNRFYSRNRPTTVLQPSYNLVRLHNVVKHR